ncbi:hypothetical protein ACWC4E_21935, partial [Streptomyces sp. NPDC001273]
MRTYVPARRLLVSPLLRLGGECDVLRPGPRNAFTHSAGDRFVCRLHLTAALIRVEVEDQAL